MNMRNNIQTIIDKFDKEFIATDGNIKTIYMGGCEITRLNNFLKDSLTSMLDDRDKELQQKVGILRQWLNEDRITDVSRMVTSEQILNWLK